MRTDTTIYRARVRQSPRRIALRRTVFLTGVVVLLLVLVGLAFAGSQTELSSGTTIAGVDVGGMSEAEATRLLSSRAAALESTPVTFTAGGMPFALTWWSLTFPVGTFVTGTTQLAAHTGLPAFRLAAAIAYLGLLSTWLLVAVRTLRGGLRGGLFAPPAPGPIRAAKD